MKTKDFTKYINGQSPRYAEPRRNIMDRLSKKGAHSQGGHFTYLGPYYELYMYAFFLGFHLNQRTPLSDRKGEFLKFGNWQPELYTEYILMLISVRHKDKINWNEMECDFDDEQIREKAREMITLMEEYVNAGLIYLEGKYENDPNEFNDPFVFINLLNEVITSDKEI